MPDYWRPETLAQALPYLRHHPRIAAGCTDLFAATDRPDLTIGDDRPVLDITAIAELRGIEHKDNGIRIGAATTWSDIVRADLPPACRSLQLAAREVGSIQIQNAATVAGNLCNASPAADGVPPLLTLDAEVELQSIDDLRWMKIAEFVNGPRRTDLRPGEMVTGIFLPSSSLMGTSNFKKLGARKYLVISIAMVAIRLVVEGDRPCDAAVAVGACSPVARRLPEVEVAILAGGGIDDGLVARALSPIDDVRADAGYRCRAAAVMLRRMLSELLGGAERAA